MSNDRLRDIAESLLSKGTVVLTVNITSVEAAEEILMWMYAPIKPMKAQLVGIDWDKNVVSKREYDAIQMIKDH